MQLKQFSNKYPMISLKMMNTANSRKSLLIFVCSKSRENWEHHLKGLTLLAFTPFSIGSDRGCSGCDLAWTHHNGQTNYLQDLNLSLQLTLDLGLAEIH